MLRKLLYILGIPTLALAQVSYTVSKTTAVSSSAEVITVQQPATSAKIVRFVSGSIGSTVTCAYTIERDGTAASSTTLAVNAVNPTVSPTAKVTAFSGSNVGTGTVIGRGTVTAGQIIPLDFTGIYMIGSSTALNFTIRMASCTGTIDINIKATEGDT
jgi:hypothetical protein